VCGFQENRRPENPGLRYNYNFCLLAFCPLALDFLSAFCFLLTAFCSPSTPSSRAKCLMNRSPRCASASPEGARSLQMAAAAASSGSGCAKDSMGGQASVPIALSGHGTAWQLVCLVLGLHGWFAG